MGTPKTPASEQFPNDSSQPSPEESSSPPNQQPTQDLPVVIVGAGLSGTLLAIMLAKRGLPVELFERRPDLRKADIPPGRSINLALSCRGIRALERVGLDEDIMAQALPMYGRQMHTHDEIESFQAYGQPGQAIFSVSRGHLNTTLLNHAETLPNLNVHFEHRCLNLDLNTPSATFQTPAGTQKVKAQLVIGADGAFSAVRAELQKTPGFNFDQHYLTHGYKELTIPPTPEGEFALNPQRLHIWPRDQFMLIALPNADHSFTCTLFLPLNAPKGTPNFADLKTPTQVERLFAEEFPSALPLLPKLAEMFLENSESSLITTRCGPFSYENKVVLVGDAAHAVVPFYGQGMNAAFEDCRVLDDLIAQHETPNWAEILPKYHALRKPNADAIRILTLQNYEVMRSHVASPGFLLRKRAEALLHRWFPTLWIPLYTMVSFTHTPYAEAIIRAKQQERWLNVALFMLATLMTLILFIFIMADVFLLRS